MARGWRLSRLRLSAASAGAVLAIACLAGLIAWHLATARDADPVLLGGLGAALAVVAAALVFTRQEEQRRAQAQEALQSSEQMHRSMVIALNEGVVICDAQGRVQGANPAAERMLRRSVDEMRALGLADWVAIDAAGAPFEPRDLPVARALSTGEPQRGTLVGDVARDGSVTWLMVNVEPLAGARADRSRGAVVSLVDVTERRRLDAALVESEATTRTLMNSLADGVFVAQDYRFVYANTALPELLGYGPGEFADLPFDRVIAPEMLGIWTERFTRRVGSGDEPLRTYDVPFMHKNGTSVVTLELNATRATYQGRPAVLGLVRDVTSRQRAAAELALYRDHLEELVAERTRELSEALAARAETEQFVRLVTDKIPGRVGYWNAELRCRFANRAYCEHFGLSREAMLDTDLRDLLGPAHFAALEPRLRAALAGQEQHFEDQGPSPGGRVVTTLIHFMPDLRDGRVRGFSVLALDVTQTREDRQALQRLNDELVVARDKAQAAALAKSTFLANMSHEIRTPMNAIIGLTHLMQREAQAPRTAERLERVADAASHLLGIINDILDFSKIDAGKLELEIVPFELDALVSRACALVEVAAAAKGLELKTDLGEAPWQLRGDATRLSQALVNLLSNAVKFTERGSVLVRARVAPDVGEGLLLRIEVHDTGIGLDGSQVEQVFSAFEQADSSTTRRFGGTGLGLGITRRLARLMGGDAGAHSVVGAGSTFWFSARVEAPLNERAPLASGTVSTARVPAGVPHGATPAEAALRNAHAGARILLAEDNPVNQEVAVTLLELAGLRVDVAPNGSVAVDMALTTAYDLILLDLQMPVMDGLEACRHLKASAQTARIPVLAMTANAYAEHRAACLAVGMSDHISKPVDPSVLYATLLRWLPGPAVSASAPGVLNRARGLAFFGGKHDVYRTGLRRFVEIYGHGLAGVDVDRSHPGTEAATALGREVHSLAGAASTVGADVLAAHSADVLQALKRGAGPPEVDALLVRLSDALERVLAEVREEVARLEAQL